MKAEKEKRVPCSYKVTKRIYDKAMRRAKKEKLPLANLIEKVVDAYAKGYDVLSTSPTGDVYLNNCL